MPSTRRGFLAACGVAVSAGCSSAGAGAGLGGPAYQIVGGVEWKTLRGTRENTVEKVARNGPVDGPVVDSAPVDADLRTVAHDETVVDLSGEGPLVLSPSTIDRLENGYRDPYGVVVLTLYDEDPHTGVPQGNSYGYRVGFAQFNRVDPGDRISLTLDRGAAVPTVGTLLTVDRAGER